jgi:hypothetical protein
MRLPKNEKVDCGHSLAPMEVENLVNRKVNFSCKKRATQEAPFFA